MSWKFDCILGGGRKHNTSGFIMPVDVGIGGKNFRLQVTDEWETMPWATELPDSLRVDPNYYVGYFKLLGDTSGE